MSNAKQQAAQHAYAEVITRAWEDPTFKKQLMRDPKKAIESVMGSEVNVPAGKTLKVIDQTDDNFVYITIPGKSAMEELELTDEQLDLVSGGMIKFPWIICWPQPPVIFW